MATVKDELWWEGGNAPHGVCRSHSSEPNIHFLGIYILMAISILAVLEMTCIDMVSPGIGSLQSTQPGSPKRSRRRRIDQDSQSKYGKRETTDYLEEEDQNHPGYMFDYYCISR